MVFSILLLVSLPALNLGLLSDYKICGDAECESKFQTSKQNGRRGFCTTLDADVYSSIHLFTM